MGFPKRYRQAACPGYDDLSLRILANPIGVLYDALLSGDTETPEHSQALGAALQEAYGGDRVEGYGVAFDFSTPEQAIATIQNEAIPIDLRVWLRNAPLDLITFEREEASKNLKASFVRGK